MYNNLTIDNIEEKGTLLYRYIRGSMAQGTYIEGKSDIDHCSIYLAPNEQLLGLGQDYQDELSDERHDNVALEFGKFMRLLLKSNPTVLEALFVDDEFVEYEHPIMTHLKKHRDKFVTKKCFKTFGEYAVSQIKKAHSLNKKILHDAEKKVERRTAMSFCYTYKNQGSIPIEKWLDERGLLPGCCGLNRIPNMKDMYGVFYDWGQHTEKLGFSFSDAVMHLYHKKGIAALSSIKEENITFDSLGDEMKFKLGKFVLEENFAYERYIDAKPIGYRGIFKDENSTEVRLSSIEDKDDKPICYMYFNKDGFIQHCKAYKEYQDWLVHRNPVRYDENKGTLYDAKNVSQAFRLMNMCIEIAKGDGFHVNRKDIDADFLLDVKHHKYEYDEIIKMLEEKKLVMDEAIAKSTLPDDIDIDFVNDFVIKVRKWQIAENDLKEWHYEDKIQNN